VQPRGHHAGLLDGEAQEARLRRRGGDPEGRLADAEQRQLTELARRVLEAGSVFIVHKGQVKTLDAAVGDLVGHAEYSRAHWQVGVRPAAADALPFLGQAHGCPPEAAGAAVACRTRPKTARISNCTGQDCTHRPQPTQPNNPTLRGR